MSSLNKKPLAAVRPVATTHQGAVASVITPEQTLRRLSMASMLWEDNFYVDGKTTADIIGSLIPQCDPQFVAAVAFEARTKMKLRHLPLLIAREMARGPVPHRLLVAKLLPDIIQRADELTEFLAIYWKDKPDAPLSAQVKKGLARAFPKFNEYALAKYNRAGAVKLRDVAFLTHPKPGDVMQASVFSRLVNKDTIPTHTKGGHQIHNAPEPIPNPGMETPDTWEVELSAGKGENKKDSWERLLVEKKLGALAFLRNLRNMSVAGVSDEMVQLYASTLDVSRVLPFRYLAAARVQPQHEPWLEKLMFKSLADAPKFKGRTVLLVDISGSMADKVSAKSDLTRLDAAKALAMLLREVCTDFVVGTFNTTTTLVPARRGFALGDAIGHARGGTELAQAVQWATAQKYDRLIVLTDEQSRSRPAAPVAGSRGYIINVAAYKNGVGYGAWNHIDGWSEAVIDYIQTFEGAE